MSFYTALIFFSFFQCYVEKTLKTVHYDSILNQCRYSTLDSIRSIFNSKYNDMKFFFYFNFIFLFDLKKTRERQCWPRWTDKNHWSWSNKSKYVEQKTENLANKKLKNICKKARNLHSQRFLVQKYGKRFRFT